MNEEDKKIQELSEKYKNFDLNNNQSANNNSFEKFQEQKEDVKKNIQEKNISQKHESVYGKDIYQRERNTSRGIGIGSIIFITIFSLFIIGTTSAYYLGAFDSFENKDNQVEDRQESEGGKNDYLEEKDNKIGESKYEIREEKGGIIGDEVVKKRKGDLIVLDTAHYSNGNKKSQKLLINNEEVYKIWLPNNILYAWKGENTRVVNYFNGNKKTKEEKKNKNIYTYSWYINGSLYESSIMTVDNQLLEKNIYYENGRVLITEKRNEDSRCYSESGQIVSEEECFNLILKSSKGLFGDLKDFNFSKTDMKEMLAEFKKIMPTEKEIKKEINNKDKELEEYERMLLKYSLDKGCGGNDCVKCNVLSVGRNDIPHKISNSTSGFTMRVTIKDVNGFIITDNYDKDYDNWANSHSTEEELKFTGMHFYEIRECVEYNKENKKINFLSTNELMAISDN